MKWCWAALMLTACRSNSGIPGSDVVGTFAMTAEPTGKQCDLSDVPAVAFDFVATLSRNPATEQSWLTLRGYARDASWDGQYLYSDASARRTFADCSGCDTDLAESMQVALLSESQAAAVNGQCPDNPLTGGVPGENEALGILKPAHRPGAEALLACGEMNTVIHSANLCPKCEGCFVQYRLKGTRQ